jgi:death on curing protein
VSEPVWLPIEAVIETNRDLVAETGEPFFLRDRGLLESALDKPKNLYLYSEPGVVDMVDLATELLFAIARKHAFVQGNKRTAFASALMFLELNGYRVDEADEDMLGMLIVSVLERDLSEETFIKLLRKSIRPAED